MADDEGVSERWLGLLDDLGEEVDYAGYCRQQLLPSDWRIVHREEALLTVTNNGSIWFPANQGDPLVVGGAAVWDARVGGRVVKRWDGIAAALVDTEQDPALHHGALQVYVDPVE